MAATPSLVVKYDTREGAGAKTVSNRYHFNGGVPADAAHWNTFATAVINAFKLCLPTELHITEVVGYVAGSDVAVWSRTDGTAGTFDIAANSAHESPGFCCALIRWATTARTTKNHPIYLFSFIHGVASAAATGATSQNLHGTLLTRLQTYAAAWVTGFSDGTNTLVRAGPNGATGGSPTVDGVIRDHDLSPR